MKKLNKKGFTLIELLAVIVILGLLMAIAIPSVTKYITQSRKKTLTNTIGNYMTALVSEVNNMDYTFTSSDTIYAVPIECIAVERGGTNPFGEWYPAAKSNWAWVLVQYDDGTSSYTYGFTFKDSAGYGLTPYSQPKIDEKGSQIITGNTFATVPYGDDGSLVASLTTAKGYYAGNWVGFKDVDDETKLVVLESTTTPSEVDGRTKCLKVQGV